VDPALAKLKDLNLVAKNEVVYEEPGGEKGFFKRFAEKINPFSSSSSNEAKPQSGEELIAKKNDDAKKESSGILSSLWPSGSKEAKTPVKESDAKTSALLAGIDQSLTQKGIDPKSQEATLKAPAADLPKPEPAGPPPMDTRVLLGSIDANLQKAGTNPDQLPQPPPAAAAFNDSSIVQSVVAASDKTPAMPANEILSSIDQKLRAKGVEPANFAAPPSPAQVKEATAPKPQPKTVELEPRLTVERGPLFLSPGDAAVTATATQPPKNAQPPASEPKQETASRPLVKGPVQTQAAASNQKPVAPRTPANAEEGTPGVFGQLQQDMEKASKILNPFNW
jgi:hypothetical protein